MIALEIDVIAHRGVGPFAVAPVANTDVIADVRVHAVYANECSVHLCIAHWLGGEKIAAVTSITNVFEFRQFLLGHYQVVNRLTAGYPSLVRAG